MNVYVVFHMQTHTNVRTPAQAYVGGSSALTVS